MPDPAPLSLNTPNVLDLQFITVTVRTDFLWREADGKVEFHWRSGGAGHLSPDEALGNGDPIIKAKVELLKGAAVLDTAETDRDGQAHLETSQLIDGDYTVRITPENSRTEPAGPAIAEKASEAPLPKRMYNPLDVTVTLSGGLIQKASIEKKIKYASLGNRVQSKWPPATVPTDHLPIDLKPIWIRGGRALAATSRPVGNIRLIIIHNTAADDSPKAKIGPDINTFLDPPPPPEYHEIHYLMDLNGHIIKFMKDSTVSNHAGGKWKGKSSNEISIGLEIVHKEEKTGGRASVPEYTDDQYTSLLDFVARVVHAYPFNGSDPDPAKHTGIHPSQIAGHSDVGTHIWAPYDYDLLVGNRDFDPGQVFRWEKLEAQGWGMIPQNVALGDAYGGVFNLAEAVMLQKGDYDGKPATHGHHEVPARLGGQDRPGTAGTPILDLQTDLANIGYSVKKNGTYDKYTDRAVAAFQRHFFSGNRRLDAATETAMDGKVDKTTAQMIKNVLAGVPAP